MKKIAIILITFLCMTCITSCMNIDTNSSNPSNEYKTTIKMELDKDYDEADPLVNEALFYVTENLNDSTAKGILEMDGRSIALEIKNNKTNEVLWNHTWDKNIQSENFTIPLKNLKKENEYVLCLTGTKINEAMIKITFDSSFVKERDKPLS